MTTPGSRTDLLDDELTRLTPGLRPFSVGILRLCRKLGLKLAVGGATDGDEAAREVLTVAWLLDERHSLAEIRLAAENPDALFAAVAEYEFQIPPAFLMAVKREIQLTNQAVEAAGFEIEPKPGAAQGASPQGKS